MEDVKFVSRFRTAIGLELRSVEAEIFHFRCEANFTNPNGLKLVFEGGVALTVHGAPDGFSLLIRDEPLQTLDMGDAGNVSIENLSETPIWSLVLGARLSKSLVYADHMQRKPFGFHMEFGVAAVGVWNFGDDLYVYDALPVEALSEEPNVAVEIA